MINNNLKKVMMHYNNIAFFRWLERGLLLINKFHKMPQFRNINERLGRFMNDEKIDFSVRMKFKIIYMLTQHAVNCARTGAPLSGVAEIPDEFFESLNC